MIGVHITIAPRPSWCLVQSDFSCTHSPRPHHTVPYHTIPYRTVPYRTVPYRTVPYRTVPYRTVPYHTIPHHTIPYHTIPESPTANPRFVLKGARGFRTPPDFGGAVQS